ncbi:nitroreductase family deazaflavin-dependent oxidoreductase [Rubrobacter taiwanensis]|uniref:Nitroreductase family deazaflavin-dependent oxidoreductase n=1 Tax=Rubrobacter taiwanensis TaxID=185139 RepID=A0A4R1BFQ0_9ACTN|nr:nitroreductase family deazaflavin-dependent oxidoreductase [Rubrobacter taiwanensis]TCJ15954.1 nitroreductase family deazaflavin-dependent oxidoreductase [Rubrobacter taiwanensis]
MPEAERHTGRKFSPLAERTLRLASDLHTLVYRLTGGRVAGRFRGGGILLLTTTGRKSGKRRTAPLLYVPDGDALVVVASKGGAPNHPAWWLNLRANPEAEVEVSGRKLRVRATEATGPERGRLWQKAVEAYPPYEDYQKKTSREIPVVVLHPI